MKKQIMQKGVKVRMKKFITILILAIILLLNVNFVFGGDGTKTGSTDGENPGEIVSYIDESW
ncbi:MAG: hypothetical protein PHT84_05780 [Candidatus Pacebacteria bacterium]|nr:hypothetical protein [Candidatus Paceibacterota bacterium]